MPELPDRNLALELVRATEAAALAASRWMGRGDRVGADRAAVNATHLILNSVAMDGIVVIGEGEKDKASMLFNGERLGSGEAPKVDIAVDPIDGTRLLVTGRSGAISVVAISERDTMYTPSHVVYMEKIATGPQAANAIDINAPVETNLKEVAKAKGMDVQDLAVVILDRPRHEVLAEQVRRTGARIKFITDGDVLGGMMTCMPETGIDVLIGIGGSPEAVILACALKCLSGNMQCKLWPRDEQEAQAARAAGLILGKVLTLDDLVASENVFFAATGITNSELLAGVRYYGDSAITDSLVMRSKSGTVRRMQANHRLHKLMQFSPITYRQDT